MGLLTPLPLQEVPPFALCWTDKLRELLVAAGQFLTRGHQRAALLMPASGPTGDQQSEAGFLEAFHERKGVPVTPIVAQHDGTAEEIRRVLDTLLASKHMATAFCKIAQICSELRSSRSIRPEGASSWSHWK